MSSTFPKGKRRLRIWLDGLPHAQTHTPLQSRTAAEAGRPARAEFCPHPSQVNWGSLVLLFEDSGPDGVHRFTWRTLGSARSLNSPTRVAPGVRQHGFPGPAPSARSACPSCPVGPRISNLGTPGKLHTSPPARSPPAEKSSFPRRTARARFCPGRLPQPPAGGLTNLGPRCPPRGVRRQRPGRLHPRGRKLSSRAPLGASVPSARSWAHWADRRRPLRRAGHGRLLQSQPSPRGTGRGIRGPCPSRGRPGPAASAAFPWPLRRQVKSERRALPERGREGERGRGEGEGALGPARTGRREGGEGDRRRAPADSAGCGRPREPLMFKHLPEPQ